MSWAGDSPEQWDRVTRAAVRHTLTQLTDDPIDMDTLAVVVEILQDEFPGVFQYLIEQIPQEALWEAEANYHATHSHTTHSDTFVSDE